MTTHSSHSLGQKNVPSCVPPPVLQEVGSDVQAAPASPVCHSPHPRVSAAALSPPRESLGWLAQSLPNGTLKPQAPWGGPRETPAVSPFHMGQNCDSEEVGWHPAPGLPVRPGAPWPAQDRN